MNMFEVNFCPTFIDEFTGLESYDPITSNSYMLVQAFDSIQAEAIVKAQFNNKVRVYSVTRKN